MFIGLTPLGINLALLSPSLSFTPASLFAAGQQGAWYDPSTLASLFQDGAGTVAVTAAGQSVGRMSDRSGRANHANQLTAVNRPTYAIDANGKNTVLFSGVDPDFLSSSTGGGGNNSFFYSAVIRPTINNNFHTLFSDGVVNSGSGYRVRINKQNKLELAVGKGVFIGPSIMRTTTTSAVGGTIPANTAYWYMVTALTATNGESPPSNQVYVQTGGTTNTNSNALTWDTVVGTNTYKLYRGFGFGAQNQSQIVGAVSTFTDTNANWQTDVRPAEDNQYVKATSLVGVTIGQPMLLTVWDDGTNLNVQLGTGPVNTTPRPDTSIAGTAGFSVGANVSVDFLSGNYYPSIYRQLNLTAGERANVQTYCASKGNPTAPAVFSPLQMFANTEQGVWFDPSDFSTLFQDSAGTIPVTTVGQFVGLMQDKSGRNNHASQATAGNRPALQIDGNGKYFLAFTGAGQFMQTPSIDFTATQLTTAFVGIKRTAETNGMVFETSINGDSTPGTFSMGSPLGAGKVQLAQYKTAYSWRGSSAAVLTIPATLVLTASYALNGDVASEMLLRANTTTLALSGTGNPGPAGVGAYGNQPLFIGQRSGGNYPLNANLYSLIVRGAASSADEVVAIETYVNGKTGAY